MLSVWQRAEPRFYPWEPTVPNSNLSWYHAGSLKSAMEEVFPHKLENTIYQDFFFLQRSIYQHSTGFSTLSTLTYLICTTSQTYTHTKTGNWITWKLNNLPKLTQLIDKSTKSIANVYFFLMWDILHSVTLTLAHIIPWTEEQPLSGAWCFHGRSKKMTSDSVCSGS